MMKKYLCLLLFGYIGSPVCYADSHTDCVGPMETWIDSCAETEYDSCIGPRSEKSWFDQEISGIDFDFDVTQFYLGTAHGGLQQEFRYSGHGDYVMNLNMDELVGLEGMFIKFRAEHRFGQSANGLTGALLPQNIQADLPVADSENLMLTNLLITQMFSEQFGVFFGKLDTFDGDQNAFASGRGKTQFSNAAFVVTPVGFRTVVYSTLGAGFFILKDQEPIFTFTVLNPTDTAGTSGFDELFTEGVAVVPELRLPTNFFGLPGHQLFGGTWSSRNFASLDQSPLVVLPSVPITRESGSWSLYWNFDQYLYTQADNPQNGWGLFGRAGIADNETNPLAWFLSFGVGGQSMLPGREADTFGLGWYYSRTSRDLSPFLVGLLGGVGDGQGVECYYSVAVNEWLNLTADLQVIDPARSAVDTSVLLGVRAVMNF